MPRLKQSTVMNIEEMPETLTVEQVSDVLGISLDKVYLALHDGRIPSLRFGTTFRVPRRALIRILETGELEETSPRKGIMR